MRSVSVEPPPQRHRASEALFQYLINLGPLKAKILITLVSTVTSALMMLAVHLMLAKAWDRVSTVTFAMSILFPLLIAPAVSHFFVTLLYELDKAHQAAHLLSITDGLTGAYNRRYFMTSAETEFVRTRRYQMPVSIIMFDVDHFKLVNDSFGHAVGDDVLVSITNAARTCLREHDLLARHGGEEFVVLLPHTDSEGAVMVAERIRAEVAKHNTRLESGQVISVSVSLGVVSLDAANRANDAVSVSAALNQADAALYQAKAAGRNQTVVAAPKPHSV